MSILLISDDKDFQNITVQKLVFLRSNDQICVSDYSNALYDVKIKNSKIVLVHENLSKNTTLELIKELRKTPELCIILLASSYDKDFILSAYDCGIDDFMQSSADDYELIIRIVNNIKHNSVKLSKIQSDKVLEAMGIVDCATGVYKSSEKVVRNMFFENGAFIAFSNASNMDYSVENLSKTLKMILRSEDFIAYDCKNTFYLVLKNADINGAIGVLNKIKENFGGNLELNSALMQFCKEISFEGLEKAVLPVLSNARATNAEYLIVDQEDTFDDDWLENDSNKDYKLFKKMYDKKLNEVIIPVFKGLQEGYKDKLPGIDFHVNLDECTLSLKTKNCHSIFKVAYPGFAKVVVSVIHDGLDSPENTEETLSLSQINEKSFANLLDDFINEFKMSRRV